MFPIFSSADFVHKKITRNDNVIELFKLYGKILDEEIKIKQDLKKFYDGEINRVERLNRLEREQLTQYTLERQNDINAATGDIGVYTKTSAVQDSLNRIETLKGEVEHSVDVVKRIQAFIPETGSVINYAAKVE